MTATPPRWNASSYQVGSSVARAHAPQRSLVYGNQATQPLGATTNLSGTSSTNYQSTQPVVNGVDSLNNTTLLPISGNTQNQTLSSVEGRLYPPSTVQSTGSLSQSLSNAPAPGPPPAQVQFTQNVSYTLNRPYHNVQGRHLSWTDPQTGQPVRTSGSRPVPPLTWSATANPSGASVPGLNMAYDEHPAKNRDHYWRTQCASWGQGQSSYDYHGSGVGVIGTAVAGAYQATGNSGKVSEGGRWKIPTVEIPNSIPPADRTGRSYNPGYEQGKYTQFASNGDPLAALPDGDRTDHTARRSVPGYGGYIRGRNFVSGGTFGSTSRRLHKIPTVAPTAP